MNKLEIIIKAMDEKLAENITAIDMQAVSPLFDAFIICSAGNDRLLQAIQDNIEEKCEEQGIYVNTIEGKKKSKWVLMDYGDIIIHIFQPQEREAYSLEKLWADMPRIDITEYLQ